MCSTHLQLSSVRSTFPGWKHLHVMVVVIKEITSTRGRQILNNMLPTNQSEDLNFVKRSFYSWHTYLYDKIIFTPSTPKQKKKIENRYKCLLITFCSFSGSLFDLSHRPARGRRWREGTPQSSAGHLGHDPGLSGSPLQVWGSSGPERTSARHGFRVQHFHEHTQVKRYRQWPRYHWVFRGALTLTKEGNCSSKSFFSCDLFKYFLSPCSAPYCWKTTIMDSRDFSISVMVAAVCADWGRHELKRQDVNLVYWDFFSSHTCLQAVAVTMQIAINIDQQKQLCQVV